MYVCHTITFETSGIESSLLVIWYIWYTWYEQVKFVHEGHQVKVKVTEAKKCEIPYSHYIKLRLAVTLVP